MKKIINLGLTAVALVVLTAAGCQSGSRPDIVKEGGLAPTAPVANNVPEAVTPAPPAPAVVTKPASKPINKEISIQDFSFSQSSLTVPKGSRITWVNDDPAPHQLAFEGFSSDSLATGQSWSYTFKQSGTFNYYCSFHPAMVGSVTVQ